VFTRIWHLTKITLVTSGFESWKCSCGIRCADHMSTQYRLVQSGKTASGSCRPRFVRACSATDFILTLVTMATKVAWRFPTQSCWYAEMHIFM
jgi:hypothetical protein